GKTINYGLLGIKNVGADFVDEIVNERQNGEFKDLADFCMRMQDGHFNRRAVESLIRCGAMDCFNANRRQMLQALPSIASNVENYRQSTKYGQVGFFDLGQGDAVMFEVEMPDVAEFAKTELLKMEKEMTGLYLSGHPMDKYENICRSLGYANCAQLIEAGKEEMPLYKDRSYVKLCGIITHITLKQTKNGASMAFVTVEDLYGSIEIIVFPKTLEQYSQLLYDSSIISIGGSLSIEEEKDAKILANEITLPPSDADVNKAVNLDKNEPKKKKRTGLFLRFDSADDDKIRLAKRVTAIFEGNVPLYFYYADTGKYELQPRADFVEVNNTELAELRRILGESNVAYNK
ncbi:MAG: OB-fold nucleic acid binding domain-containing protein, partial [Eubacterium sp.]